MRKFLFVVCFLSVSSLSIAQKNVSAPKYPGLLWEITGNGLSKPSYLFGTMHVSSKMAFHLSDSFYYAVKNCDMVALELNPEHWQKDMMRLDNSKDDVGKYMRPDTRNYITESSFKIEKCDDNLKAALTENPSQINSLLYRSYQYQADYEENTYLDLYIYQTGRKLGKLPGGVENYMESEKIVFEAYEDMAKEKNRKRPDTDGESMYDIEKKIQDAYKRGDLDLLDSLQKLTATSPAYMEKFLYKRNDIQANSIDTILRKHSLFVGVGAAHLPGERGVIELLRKKGYRLRPIQMLDRDADSKEEIDKMRVPANFQETSIDNGYIQMMVPGPLYKRSDTRVSLENGSWQYADMSNGSYYMLTRVKTYAGLWGQSVDDMKKKVDSLLYENIPGKIIKKEYITRNGYPGFDITNRTRRGDLQRYNIVVTPIEIIIFKMSGNDDYVDGKEAETFFNSINISPVAKSWTQYEPETGGFSVKLPHNPNVFLNTGSTDRIDRWEYSAMDSVTGNSYFIWKKVVNNYSFMEEDTFDLSLIGESLMKSELIEKETKRTFTKQNGYNALDMDFELKNGGQLSARAILRGPQYYLLFTANKKKKNLNAADFFQSFQFSDYKYGAPQLFADTMFKFTVNTPVAPVLDTAIVKMMNRAMSPEFMDQIREGYYSPEEKYAAFRNDTTGESVFVQITEYPKYYYVKDSAKYWNSKYSYQYDGFIQRSKDKVFRNDSCYGYQTVLLDTNTVRKIKILELLKDNRLFKVMTLTDTIGKESTFISNFFASFMPEEKKYGPSVFESKLDLFFNDYYSTDSTLKKKANSAITSINFGSEGISKIEEAINKLGLTDKDYFETKRKFISELGFIRDSCCLQSVQDCIERIYNKTTDTSYFQNTALESLARLKTQSSYNMLKDILIQDPPVLDDNSDFLYLLEDSLKLARTLYPDILQLATLEDYRMPVVSLLATLSDSGLIATKDFESYYSKLYFDAKIELKRQQIRNEKFMEQEAKLEEDDDDSYSGYSSYNYRRKSYDITQYATLLAGFYDQYPAVTKFFDKLLSSNDRSVAIDAAIILIKNKKAVPDSILSTIASNDKYRAELLKGLEKIKRTDLFPQKYKTQEAIARSILLQKRQIDKFNAIELLSKKLIKVKEKEGYVYFFKYKIRKEDDWQIGIGGLQPKDLKEVSSNDILTKLTTKKLKEGESQSEQLNNQLKRALYSLRPSASQFYDDDSYYRGRYLY